MTHNPRTDPRSIKLHCAICFDLGFTETCFYGQTGSDADDGPASNATTDGQGDTSNREKVQPDDKEQLVETEEVRRKLEATSLETGRAKPSTVREWLDSQEKRAEGGNPLVLAEPMRSKVDGRLTEVNTLFISFDVLEPEVSKLLQDGGEVQKTLEGYYTMIRARSIKNRMTPLEYWIKQYCTAMVKKKHEPTKPLPPCVQIRRGVHEFLMERDETYRNEQDMLMRMGFVRSTDGSSRLAVAHPAFKKFSSDNPEGGTAVGAFSWSVEVFLLDEIPSPYRRVFLPDDGLLLSKRSLPSGDTGSDRAFLRATSWFKTCVTSHPSINTIVAKLEGDVKCYPACPIPTAPALPERVIDIGVGGNLEGDVSLVQTEGKPGRYVCLSHRWGDDTPTTTSRNLKQNLEKIPWSTLSQSFQDAIVFFRKFSRWYEGEFKESLRYIWIDSLCILQDSDEDWKSQAQTMCNIYSSSLVTLAEGCLNTREKRLFSKMSPEHESKVIEVTDAEGRRRAVHFRRPIFHPDIMMSPSTCVPTWTRGWILQERLLSPRLLVFGSDELSWRCSHCSECECGIEQTHVSGVERWRVEDAVSLRLPDVNSRKWMNFVLGPSPTEQDLRTAWRLILQSYSGLDLTYKRDTLPAIAGLAESFHLRRFFGNLRPKNYFAGVWFREDDGEDRDEAVFDLLWRLRFRELGTTPRVAPSPVAQSWCWAHPQCAIVYPFLHDTLVKGYTTGLDIRPAFNVPHMPSDVDRAALQAAPWIKDAFTDAPPAGLLLRGPLYPTQLVAVHGVPVSVADTEQTEYKYHLGPNSDLALQNRAFSQPTEVDVLVVNYRYTPTAPERAVVTPPLVVYPDCEAPPLSDEEVYFCLPIGKFLRRSLSGSPQGQLAVVCLVLGCVGARALAEGETWGPGGPELEDLVFKRVGLAYTNVGNWTEELDEGVFGGTAMTDVRIV